MGAVLQLGSIPILVSSWGTETFGIWMMLTTIPTYFGLTDLGFVQAATSDMTMQVARGHKDQALRTFQSIWILFLIIATACIGMASALFLLDAGNASGAIAWLAANADLIVMLIAYSALSLLSRVTLAGFRSTGFYALGTLAYDALVFVEGMALLIVVYFGGDFRDAATTLIVMRVLSMGAFYLLLRQVVDWLHLGWARATPYELKRLLKPAMSAMSIPIALAVTLQGTVLIVGAVISPAAIAIYTPVRTASRLVIQIIGVVNRATMPELATKTALNAREDLKRLYRINALLIAAVLIPGGLFFAIFGSDLIGVWTAGHVMPSVTFVSLMAFAMVVHGGWYFLSNMLLATNAHGPLASTMVVIAPLSIGLCFLGGNLWGLNGVAIGVIVTEAICLARVVGVINWKRIFGLAE